MVLLRVVLEKKIDDYVNEGEVLAYVHSNGKNTDVAVKRVLEAFEFGSEW